MRYNIIQRTEIERNSKDRLTESIIKKNKQLADDYENLSDELQLCIADCKRRNRHSELAGSDVPPIDDDLNRELKNLDSDDELGGGNKRRRRRRRRSFRNKTKRTQRLRSRRQKQRNQKRNTRRGRSRRHITPHNHMK
jgi:hypothetical protein